MFYRKKNRGLLHWLDKIMFFSAVVPPGYIIYRFIRWYLKQDTLIADPDLDAGEDNDAGSHS